MQQVMVQAPVPIGALQRIGQWGRRCRGRCCCIAAPARCLVVLLLLCCLEWLRFY